MALLPLVVAAALGARAHAAVHAHVCVCVRCVLMRTPLAACALHSARRGGLRRPRAARMRRAARAAHRAVMARHARCTAALIIAAPRPRAALASLCGRRRLRAFFALLRAHGLGGGACGHR
jgi:hypothetical protein